MGATTEIAEERERAESREGSARPRTESPKTESWTATGCEPQVFLDRTGRRARRVSLAGVLVAVVGAGWLGGVIGGSAGFASLPALQTPLVAHAATHTATTRHGHARRHRTHAVEVAVVGSSRG